MQFFILSIIAAMTGTVFGLPQGYPDDDYARSNISCSTNTAATVGILRLAGNKHAWRHVYPTSPRISGQNAQNHHQDHWPQGQVDVDD
ncbi:hypothetical protein D6D01_06069 [Aureobasidium pullulans]|uniref:Uncharacterized protein n=1 Tax=Aureobasidium pullulans TaxID=5580 RepID=A0A4S9L429_AURPU|nr:hypothetical protein D6D01_06069 [Aureobasidium pullulans]